MQVVSAPTGSGKTVVLELTILRMLAAHVLDSGRWNLVPGRHKAIYVAPTRALCQEKVRDWTARLAYLHLVVLECTGDCTQQDIADLASADIIATTPYAAQRTLAATDTHAETHGVHGVHGVHSVHGVHGLHGVHAGGNHPDLLCRPTHPCSILFNGCSRRQD